MGDVLHALPALQQHDRSEEQQQARVQVVPRPPSLASQSQVLPLGRARSALHSRARPSPSARPILAELVRYALELVPDGFSARTHLLNSERSHSSPTNQFGRGSSLGTERIQRTCGAAGYT